MKTAFAALGVLAFCAGGFAQDGEPFNPGCAVPFHDMAGEHPIDASCGVEGKTSAQKFKLQNRAKNNLCAMGGPEFVTFFSLRKLQEATDALKAADQLDLRTSRAQLQDLHTTHLHRKIGEGTRVHFTGYVVKADRADQETVNCNRGGRDEVDIHVHLAERRDDDLCDSVVAEVSPHFRPRDWAEPEHFFVEGRPVRLTGHMFFDSTHVPCKDGGPVSGNPARYSVWEIHPVYAVDVCHVSKSLSRCKAWRESDWTPLHVWLAAHEEEDEDEH